MGRHKLELNEEQVQLLAGIGCTNEEIATILNCSHDTLARNYLEALDRGRAHMKMSLRRRQIQRANKGNVGMLVWLGKQYLGQRDNAMVENNINIISDDFASRLEAALEEDASEIQEDADAHNG